jgi:hypothetical protein
VSWVAGVLCPWVEYKACETDHSSPTSVGQETVELYFYSPYTPIMYGRDNFTFTWLSVFMRDPLHAPTVNLLLYKGFDNEYIQLNCISHNQHTLRQNNLTKHNLQPLLS